MGAKNSHEYQQVDTVEELVDTRTPEEKEDALVRQDIRGRQRSIELQLNFFSRIQFEKRFVNLIN